MDKTEILASYPIPCTIDDAGNKGPLYDEYQGCGKAWAAISASGAVLAIRYMHDHGTEHLDALDPITQAICAACPPEIYAHKLQYVSSHTKAAAYKAAVAAGMSPTGPRGGRIHRGEMIARAFDKWERADHEDFMAWRTRAKAELAEIAGPGLVLSGMCSCCQFVTD